MWIENRYTKWMKFEVVIAIFTNKSSRVTVNREITHLWIFASKSIFHKQSTIIISKNYTFIFKLILLITVFWITTVVYYVLLKSKTLKCWRKYSFYFMTMCAHAPSTIAFNSGFDSKYGIILIIYLTLYLRFTTYSSNSRNIFHFQNSKNEMLNRFQS